MKLRGPIVIPILAVVLIALAFGLWWMFGRTDKLPDTIVRGNGRLEMTRTDIAAKYPGRLMSLDVHEGDLVGAGQVTALVAGHGGSSGASSSGTVVRNRRRR